MLSMYEFIRIAAAAGIFLVLAFQKTRTVIYADIVAVLMFIPFVISRQLPTYDSLHLYLHLHTACFVLLPGLFFLFFARKGKDNDGIHGVLVCRTVGFLLSNLAFLLHVKGTDFEANLNNTFVPVCYMMLEAVVIYHFYRNGFPRPHRGRSSPVDLHIKIDIALAALMGICDTIFASSVKTWVPTADSKHELLVMANGFYHLATAALGLYALGFRNIADRKGYLCCRATVVILAGLTFAYCIWFWKLKFNAWFLLGFLPAVTSSAGLVLTADRRTSSSAVGYNLRARR